MENKSKFMLRAIELSIQSAKTSGGPFGCVIVKNNKIIAEGFNQVTSNNDPTAHAEIVAIRNACQNQNNFFLKDAIFILHVNHVQCVFLQFTGHILKIFITQIQDWMQRILILMILSFTQK